MMMILRLRLKIESLIISPFDFLLFDLTISEAAFELYLKKNICYNVLSNNF